MDTGPGPRIKDVTSISSNAKPVVLSRVHFPASAGLVDPAQWLEEGHREEFLNPRNRLLLPTPFTDSIPEP
eukprot:6376821-Karenia_brevis.AAC.1